MHGLSSGKKRELEATLQHFASSVDGSQDASASHRKRKPLHQSARDRMYSVSGSMSKHASSPTGSNFRPSDSAYASMSIGANSSGTSLGRATTTTSSSTKPSDRKTDNGLQDVPEGLYPQRMVVTERERKKLVVRRLEQIFTGKLGSRPLQNQQAIPPIINRAPAPASSETVLQGQLTMHQPPSLLTEPAREAMILPQEQRSGHSGRKTEPTDNGSNSNSNGGMELGSNERSSGSSNDLSPPMPPPPEQRATRPRDLDPNRLQVPSENMDYIRHLGLTRPELLKEYRKSYQSVPLDNDGWVYLNLLCSMAQLHMVNVTPKFVRAAVSEFSTRFDLSSDGRKIRWRGGTEGTHFSSDGSSHNSEKSPSSDDTDAVKDGRKRRKTGRSSGDDPRSGNSSKDASKSGLQNGTSSESFHYKPLFAHQGSPNGLTSMEDTISSLEPVGDGIVDDSRYGRSGSGTSGGKKRRRNGAIIYYSGAPFCTDLAGDPVDVSPVLELMSTGKDPQRRFAPSPLQRTTSGSFINYKPLSDEGHLERLSTQMEIDGSDDESDLIGQDDDTNEIELDISWSKTQQFLEFRTLEPCGIGGVLPDDHFIVVVATSRPLVDSIPEVNSSGQRAKQDENADLIVRRFATMSTSPTLPWTSRTRPRSAPQFEIEYVSGRIKRLAPVPLPPPAVLFPPFSSDESSSEGSEEDSDDSDDDFVSKAFNAVKALQPIQRRSDDYPDGVDLSSGDEEGEESEDLSDDDHIANVKGNIKVTASPKLDAHLSSDASQAARLMHRERSKSTDPMNRTDRSSVATAGGVESGYNSGEEDD